jgi:hypothetical protein
VGSLATITVPDAASTPVNHNFIPLKIDGDTARFQEQSNASALGYWPLGISLRSPQAGSGSKVYRAQVSLAIPVVYAETVNGIARPVVAYTMRANVEFIIPADSTLQDRKDLRKLVVGVLGDTLTTEVLENLQNIY